MMALLKSCPDFKTFPCDTFPWTRQVHFASTTKQGTFPNCERTAINNSVLSFSSINFLLEPVYFRSATELHSYHEETNSKRPLAEKTWNWLVLLTWSASLVFWAWTHGWDFFYHSHVIQSYFLLVKLSLGHTMESN